ncbi:MAG: chemotaxis protein CheX [Bacteriovoracaceae bacterium]|nr:chemotaxis protein CheX [Bacteriovoracaceae bacterium]
MSDSEAFLKFSKPFLDATKSVFETMISTTISSGKPEFRSGNASLHDITSIIPVSGTINDKDNYSAQFVISFPEPTYIKIASAMIMEEYTVYSEEIEDVGNEISNIIMGNAKRDLTTQGYTTSMTVPNMIRGEGHVITYPKNTKIVSFPINCDHGEFIIEICFTKIDQDNS